MKVHKFKHAGKKIVVSILASFLFASPIARGDIPVIDPTNIMALIAQSLQQIEQLVNILNSMAKQFHLSGTIGNSEIQAMQNDAANEIVRVTQNADKIFNTELSMDAKPAFDACNTFNVSQALSDDLCSYIAGVTQDTNAETYNAMGGDPSKTNFANKEQAVENVIQTQDTLVKQTGQPTAGVSGASFLNPQLGGYASQTSENEATLYRKLVLGPLPANHMDQRLLKNNKDPYIAEKMKVKQDTYAARQSVAATSMSIYQQMYTKGSNGVSPMGMMEKFVKGRFGSPTWIEDITNTNPDKGSNSNDESTPAQVQRSIAESEAFGNYMKVKIYQSSLRQEVLLSTIVSIMNKQPNQDNS